MTNTLAVLGVPVRLGSISGGRFDRAPAAMRDALDRFVARGAGDAARVATLGVDVRAVQDLSRVADVAPGEALEPVVRAAEPFVRGSDALVFLGGDNSITRPGVHALATHIGLDRTGLLTLDAHHDLRATSGGLTNGNPVRALLEDGLPGANVVQIGIQPLANMPEHIAFAREAGITVATVGDVRTRGIEDVVRDALDRLGGRADAIYVDLDVDVLDRAFAPACPGARPGGLTPWELQTAARLAGEHPEVRAIDIVEVDPERDVAEVTVMTAASCVLSFAAGLASRA